MFTVKATYKGETRKLSFSPDIFPSFEQLYNQLYRIFSINHHFYLSKLLFSPNITQGGRILIGREVRTQEDYDKSIRAYKDRRWPQGLLRFSLYDEISHNSANRSTSSTLTSPPVSIVPPTSHIVSSSPILYPCPSTSSAMDVDKESAGKITSPPSCCSVQSTKADIERLITEFKEDLDHILKASFVWQGASSPSPALSIVPLSAPSTSTLDVCGVPSISPVLCSICAQQVSSWNICDRCYLVECNDCTGKTNPFCFGSTANHQWDHRSASSLPLCDVGQGSARMPYTDFMPWSMPPDIRSYSDGNNATPVVRQSVPTAPNDSSPDTSSAWPVIHHDVTCDSCKNTIEGVRHNCLECPDYDLCTTCITSGGAERHNPFHEFLELTTPVDVHREYDREISEQGGDAAISSENVIHQAICDLCDSQIRGDRYKCVHCPDFDTCSSCFSITGIQHPNHNFVRLGRSEDYIKRDEHVASSHFATCNICTKRIHGVRYKCMHTDCPDFDLCSMCESHPIALHPGNHPLLKLKTPESVIPQVSHYKHSASVVVASGSHESMSIQNAPRSFGQLASGSFIWGFRHGPSELENSDKQRSLNRPMLIPRLDEISPSISCTVPAQGSRPLPVPPQSFGSFRVGDSINETHVAPGVQGNNGRQTPVRDHRGDVGSPKSVVWPCNVGLERLMKTVSIVDFPPMGEETLLESPSHGMMPVMEAKPSAAANMSRQTLAMFSSGYGSTEVEEKPCVMDLRALSPVPDDDDDDNDELVKLSAKFIEDLTVPDGQVFPPGAEFVKCWRMGNDCGHEWPETTDLVYVAGEMLGMQRNGAVHVGAVKHGMEVEIWTGELKAPEVAGRYVSYWRLRDGNGRLFGDSIWIDIVVTDAQSSSECDKSIASSLVVMPRPSVTGRQESLCLASKANSDTDSLVSIPSSDEGVWEQIGTSVGGSERNAQMNDYVVVYDDQSSSSE